MTEDVPLPPHGRAPIPNEDRMPCRWCGSSTLIATLNHYGARCLECYECYLREPQPSPDVGDKRRDPLGWALALRTREERGDRLTPAQRDAWRAAARWVKDESDGRGESLEHAERARQRLGISG